MALTNKLTDIANAIRSKTETTEPMTLDEMPTKIEGIKTDPILQDKSVNIVANGTQTITADSGYDGLNSVEVTTNVSGGETPEKGFIVTEWDSEGNPLKITTIGFTIMPTSYLGGYVVQGLTDLVVSEGTTVLSNNLCNGAQKLANVSLPSTLTSLAVNSTIGTTFGNCKSLETIDIPLGVTEIPLACFSGCTKLNLTELSNNITGIGQNGFYNCTNLSLTKLPSSLMNIGTNAFYNCTNLALTELPAGLKTLANSVFYNCTKLAIKTIPSGVTTIPSSGFYQCTNMKQISIPNATSIPGGSNRAGAFFGCTGLNAVWIGSTITNNGLGRFSFQSCSNVKKMFIDLPRATVEAFSNYTYAFSSNAFSNSVIICNDDAGFMTKEQFDAIDWSTYTE